MWSRDVSEYEDFIQSEQIKGFVGFFSESLSEGFTACLVEIRGVY